MKKPDLDRERSEEPRSMAVFLELYNESLPESFPRASKKLLEQFKSEHQAQFKDDGKTEDWSLDVHRKRVMDWLPAQIARAN